MFESQETEIARDAERENGPVYRLLYPTELTLSSQDLDQLDALAQQRGVTFLDLGPLSETQLARFYQANIGKERFRATLSALVQGGGESEYAVGRYDIDYGTCAIPAFRAALLRAALDPSDPLARDLEATYLFEPNYAFYSPLLDPMQWPTIMSPAILEQAARTVDVGCGNGQLLAFLNENLEISREALRGIDISRAAVSLLNARGFSAAQGTLLQLSQDSAQAFVPGASADLLFLSYFVDRDADQRGTFDAAVKSLKPGGTLILEGLFPVNACDSLGGSYSTPDKLVTNGASASDDVRLVVDYLERSSAGALALEKIVTGERLVYSLDGFEILPAVFLCFGKKE